ncbi:MAG: FHA domain-containing protein [Ruminococcaceae bacterium]|nr:FHA domain-containing protein [Oscillospiraceae bacterium]
MNSLLSAVAALDGTVVYVYQAMLRYAMPVLAAFLLLRTILPLLTFRREPEIWAWLCLTNGKMLPLTHWENVVGRSKRSDVVLDRPEVSKTHAVFTRYDDGSWTVADANSKEGILVNGQRMRICALEPDDVITIGGIPLKFRPISKEQEIKLGKLRTRAARPSGSIFNTILLTVFQVLCCLSYLMTADAAVASNIFWGFAGIVICQWLLLGFYLFIRKPSFELENIVFFLCTLGMAAIAAVRPGETVKQLIAMVMGLALFLALGWALRDLERAKKLRYVAAVAGVLLLVVTLVFGKTYNGARNWLMIGSLSIQPSELSKVCFVFIGASTLDRLVNKRNLILFIAYTIVICACLAIMNDFGTALIFFAAFLIIAFLRSGSVGTIALACTSLGYAGVIALQIAPHALRRFATWRHIWEDPLNTGYQQTQALMCVASGGLFGLGAGNGMMKKLFASDSDVVFATIAEEWGLLMCIMAVVCIIVFGLFAIRSAAMGRSSFYTIGACTAAGILLVQTCFNVLGTVDVLPLTGVTMPFVSNGGSSMICAWGLLAYVKAADTRQNASFAVRQTKEGKVKKDA